MDSPPPLACSVQGCEWTTPPNLPTWELITTLMGQHTQAVHPAGMCFSCPQWVSRIKLPKFGFNWKWITRLMGRNTQADHPAGEQGGNGGGEEDADITETMEMDQDSVDKIKLTKFGFKWNLIRFSSFLSILGIVVSTLGIVGGLAITLLAGIGIFSCEDAAQQVLMSVRLSVCLSST